MVSNIVICVIRYIRLYGEIEFKLERKTCYYIVYYIYMFGMSYVFKSVVLSTLNVEKLLAIKGVGSITIAGFIAEVGDIRRFDSPKQIQKYAGLKLVENSSGKHKGRTRISKRGRRKLRKILYQVMVPLLARNKEFRGIYDYYVTRVKNPLKRRQAMVAVSCKLIRVFYAVLTKGVEYDRFKMMSDIHRKSDIIAA